jgi:hypothetical protein
MNSRIKRTNRKHIIISKTATLFNNVPRDVCCLIANNLSTDDLKSLSLVSTQINFKFDPAFVLHEDAHAVLQEVLNGTTTSLKKLVKIAKPLYKNNIYKLFVTPTHGKELHCNRVWKNTSAVSSAARQGNVYHYIYTLGILPDDQNAQLEYHVLYLKTEDHPLPRFIANIPPSPPIKVTKDPIEYVVIDSAGKRRCGNITFSDLGFENQRSLVTLRELQWHLPQMIAITNIKGDTPTYNLKNAAASKSYVLNYLYKNIPHKYRYISNSQLRDVDMRYPTMPEFRQLILEYEIYLRLVRNGLKYSIKESRNTIGQKQKKLPWHGLRLLCHLVRGPVLDINNFIIPEDSPIVDIECGHIHINNQLLSSHIDALGLSYILCHRDRAVFVQGNPGIDMVEHLCLTLKKFVDDIKKAKKIFN